jgi:hypothetical protein
LRRRIESAALVARQAATRDDGMHVRMVMQVLPPGMQHHQDADLGAQPLGVGGHVAQRRRGRLEQGVVQKSRVRQRQFGHLRGQREHDVVIFDRQQQSGLTLEPTGAGQGLAFRAVTVAT